MNNKKRNIIIIISVSLIFIIASLFAYNSYINNKINEFSKVFNQFIERSNEYIINNETEYEKIKLSGNEIISKKKYKEISELNKELSKFEDSVLNENIDNIFKKLDDFNKIDKALVSNEILAEIDRNIPEINSLVKERKFKTADNELSKLKKMTDEYISNNRELSKSELVKIITDADSVRLKEKFRTDYEWTYVGYIDTERLIESWGLPNEVYYELKIHQGEGYNWSPYIVGKNSKKVYRCPIQGGEPIYEVSNNAVIKEYKWIE